MGCTSNKSTSNSSEKKEATTESTTHVKKSEHIDYDDQKDWEFFAGKMQSPIDIVTKKAEVMTPDTGTITIDYGKEIVKAENNGHSIQITDGVHR